MKHLNSDLKPLAVGPLPDRGTVLFRKSFGDREKATVDSIKTLKGVQSQKRYGTRFIQNWMILVINLWLILVWYKNHPKLDDSIYG